VIEGGDGGARELADSFFCVTIGFVIEIGPVSGDSAGVPDIN